MKIGILGGSFDPVHLAHIQLASAALKQLHLDRVYLMLSPQSPFKAAANTTSVSKRVAMLKRALRTHPQLKLGLFECRLKKPYYTVKTLTLLKKKHPRWDLFFIVGSDAWNKFHHWKDPSKIVSMAQLVVGCRPGVVIDNRHRRAYRPQFLKGRFPAISSSAIRRDLGYPGALKNVLDPSVEHYIRTEGLYGAC